MSFACRSFDLLFLLCVFATYCQYNVHEACQLMDMYICVYIYMWTQNVMQLFLFVFLFVSPSFSFGCSLLICFFPSSFLSLSIICVLFSLFTTPTYPPIPNCVWGFFSFLSSHLPLHLPGCGGQETSGLSAAVGCGRYGEDEGARLEVCVYVPAGVLQGSGDKRPG